MREASRKERCGVSYDIRLCVSNKGTDESIVDNKTVLGSLLDEKDVIDGDSIADIVVGTYMPYEERKGEDNWSFVSYSCMGLTYLVAQGIYKTTGFN